MSERVISERSTEQTCELLDSLYRTESGRILATLIRLLGDFDLAEEAMHEAFAATLSLWPRSGVPGSPRPWLISTDRFKAIARSAAPDSIARDAEVQVLGRHGFETAVKGKNGFLCIVGRGWTSAPDSEFWNP